MTKYDKDLKYDKDVKQFQYLPYLNNINPDYIDEFNKIILKKKFGYFIDENNPNNYIKDDKRNINDRDRMLSYRKRYTDNDILYENLTVELNNMIIYYNSLKDYNKQRIYEGYLYKVQSHIYNENKWILNIINEIDEILIKNPYGIVDTRTKIININYLLLILLVSFIIYICVYNYTYD